MPGAEPATSIRRRCNPAQYTARCDGTPDRNGFYGDGIVNAAAVGADER